MRVVVADDQTIVREGLITVLETMAGIEVVGSAGNGQEALEVVVGTAPDVVLMDLRMPGMDGIEATAAIRREHPSTQVVVLTTYADDESIVRALRAGAIGYLTKDAGRDHIGRALEAAANGQAILDPVVQARLVEAAGLASIARPPAAPPSDLLPGRIPRRLPDRLTDKEAEVLGLIANGLSNSEIAARLSSRGHHQDPRQPHLCEDAQPRSCAGDRLCASGGTRGPELLSPRHTAAVFSATWP